MVEGINKFIISIGTEDKDTFNLKAGYKYNIPVYQRPYSLGVNNCQDLWNSFKIFIDNKKEKYFMGPMIVRDVKSEKIINYLFCSILNVKSRY